MAVLRGEPVIVDTGTHLKEQQWLEAVGGIVDFADVKWIYLSHDDHPRTGEELEARVEVNRGGPGNPCPTRSWRGSSSTTP